MMKGNSSRAPEDEPSVKTSGYLFSLLSHPDRNSPALWNFLCPVLSIETSDKTNQIKCPASNLGGSDEANKRREKLTKDGYVLVNESLTPSKIQTLREGIEALHAKNLPATFILLFDQTWELARESRRHLAQVCPKNSFNFDLLAWYIEPGSGGFSPHRDRQPSTAAATFHADDGQPKFATQWIALSDATPENSCLYVIPKPFDPGYIDGDTDKEDPLRRALPEKESFQHIRALPRKPGQSIIFSHRIIHWGSQSVSETHPPRIAISFVCSDPSYEPHLISAKYFTEDNNPPFSIRLLLVCAQLLIYYQRFNLTKDVIKACYDFCKEHESDLEENYRHKVFLEFVNAMKATSCLERETLVKGNSNGVDMVFAKKNEEEDETDAIMEEMLDAEAGGYGEFEDDYDDVQDDGDKGLLGNPDCDEDEEESEEEEEEASTLFGEKFSAKDDGGDSKPPSKKLKTT